jgi:hypothetical protein
VTAEVVRLHGAGPTEAAHAAKRAHTALTGFLDRCGLAANTVRAYRRQAAAYRAWLAEHTGEHPDAFADAVGAEAAVTAWRRHLLRRKASPATVNQALAAVTLLYEHGPQLRIAIKRARVERPSEPDALTPPSRARASRPPTGAASATRRSSRCCCPRARAWRSSRTSRSTTSRSPHGPARSACLARATRSARSRCRHARERIAAWLRERGNHPGPLWLG